MSEPEPLSKAWFTCLGIEDVSSTGVDLVRIYPNGDVDPERFARQVAAAALEWGGGLGMQQIKLQMGELTAQEERTLRAFQRMLRAKAREIREGV